MKFLAMSKHCAQFRPFGDCPQSLGGNASLGQCTKHRPGVPAPARFAERGGWVGAPQSARALPYPGLFTGTRNSADGGGIML
ncbi:MAG: hypothetical protein GY717_20385 [Rhodobacteraceae bacterium]|nr:hypothetical protein [Paracoccaceae bacterium]